MPLSGPKKLNTERSVIQFQTHTCDHYSPLKHFLMPRKAHRGRIQAQGGGLEASESWSQDEPLTAKQGRTLLQQLKAKLSKKERRERKHHLEKLEDLIDRAEETGGLHAHYGKSFQDPGSDIRVDVEVLGGTAFVCVVLAIILWAIIQ